MPLVAMALYFRNVVVILISTFFIQQYIRTFSKAQDLRASHNVAKILRYLAVRIRWVKNHTNAWERAWHKPWFVITPVASGAGFALYQLMIFHPVQLRIETPKTMARIHIVPRLVFMIALSTIGWSSIFWIAYLSLPALAAVLILKRGVVGYFEEDVPKAHRALDWLAGAYAYLWLLTDEVPSRLPERPQLLDIRSTNIPTPASALWRLLLGLPALLLVCLLSVVGSVVWFIGAVTILISQRMPVFLADYQRMCLVTVFRLLAYQLSIVDRYPSVFDSSLDASHSSSTPSARDRVSRY
jgi:hypothetical protein